MPHAYVSLDALKSASVLNITGTDYDARLLRLGEAASAAIDRRCNRHFYVLYATRHLDGDGSDALILPDLIAADADGVRTDENGDGAFETIWSTADYRLLPLDADPAAYGNPNSQPYTRLEPTGAKALPQGRERIQIAGNWGWWEHLMRIDATAAVITNASDTTLTLSAAAPEISAGNTLRIDAEQMYVRAVDGVRIIVARGVNGTAAAAHTRASAIRLYEYPPPVEEAALMLAARLWRGVLTGGAEPRDGGIDDDIMLLLSSYRKPPLGGS